FLKESVKNERVFLTECYDLRISKLVSLIAPFNEMELDFITDIYCNIDNMQRIRFLTIFEGYCFEFFFLTDKSQSLSGLGVLKKNKRILKMPYIDIFSIPEFQKSLSEMIESQKQN
ncbi:hypothetical protein NRF50_003709, partial [Acinetobacter baumannii]|nr:hypothetical protein [Acinetobacter baumannii]